ncbi:MAG: lytic murein transglycosylase [Duodenibacillus sp.]|nr:lytic murein transglycosylase [Duodenibacillus sp.]
MPTDTQRRQLLAAAAGLAAARPARILASVVDGSPEPEPAGAPEAPPPAAPARPLPPLAGKPRGFAARLAVRAWADEVSRERGIPYAWICEQLGRARHVNSSVRLMTPQPSSAPRKPKNWLAHRQIFVTPERIRRGRAFLAEHAADFEAAERRWGVPSAVVAAIIGVETNFGRNTGGYRVLDVLCTLSFDYLRRAEFFRKELASLLEVCHSSGLPVTAVTGSYAGATGLCQFMPSNIIRYGVDFDGDGRVDLSGSPADAIASVANYLAGAGWKPGLPVAWRCRATEEQARDLGLGGIRANTTLQNVLDAGVEMDEPPEAPPATPVLLVNLPVVAAEGRTDTLWRVGTQNFACILDYNHAYFYAEAVRELAAALAS